MALSLISLPAAAAAPSSAFSLRSVRATSAVRCSLSFSRASTALSASSSSSSSFLQSSASAELSLASSFSGLSLGLSGARHNKVSRQGNRQFQVRAGKASLAMTKRNRSRKSLARVHGFRKRMQTPGGRKVLKRRRLKGRKVLCPKSHQSSGKKRVKK